MIDRQVLTVGQLVRDTETGRVGELMAVTDYTDASQPTHIRPRVVQRLAFLRPDGGGVEWTTSPNSIIAAIDPWEGAP